MISNAWFILHVVETWLHLLLKDDCLLRSTATNLLIGHMSWLCLLSPKIQEFLLKVCVK